MRYSSFLFLSLLLFLILPGRDTNAQLVPSADPLISLEYFVGKWTGEGSGIAGTSKVEREYVPILKGRYMKGISRAVFEPQIKKPRGEVKEQIEIFSYDKIRKKFILRQFHLEGFVNQYTNDAFTHEGKLLTFKSEEIENVPEGWRARETFEVMSEDEFREIYELAAPNQEFQVYSEIRFKRVAEKLN